MQQTKKNRDRITSLVMTGCYPVLKEGKLSLQEADCWGKNQSVAEL